MSLKLFLVEDNPHIRKSVTEFLEQDGAVEVVNWAPTEHGAVSWLQSNCLEWEVAVVDRMRPANTS